MAIQDPSNKQYRLHALPPDRSACPPGIVGCTGLSQYQLQLLSPSTVGEDIVVVFYLVRPWELPNALCGATSAVFTVQVR